MKKGLGRIPKSLAWIDEVEDPIVPATQMEEKEEVVQPIDHTTTKDLVGFVDSRQKTSQKGLPAGWTRATFIVDNGLNEKIKAIAYWERLTVKEVMHDALTQYVQGKSVRAIPKKKSVNIT